MNASSRIAVTGGVDPSLLKSALAAFPSGVTAVTAAEDGQAFGSTVSAFCALSLDPPMVLACLGRSSRTLAVIQRVRRFAVNILAASQADLAQRFASSQNAGRFDGVDHVEGVTGSPLLRGAVANIDCEVEAITAGGDHWIILGRVMEVRLDRAAHPLLYCWREMGAGPRNPLAGRV
jgi:flavin reductase (DIM6/NTAB) family NADH-FMN oxidoreductase RutF